MPDNKFRMCNVVCYAFATVSSTGGLVQSPSVLTTVRNKAKNNGAKVFISLAVILPIGKIWQYRLLVELIL